MYYSPSRASAHFVASLICGFVLAGTVEDSARLLTPVGRCLSRFSAPCQILKKLR